MERICPECGEKVRGRADKIFCSDYCRNVRNNSLNKDSKNIVRTTNNWLRKNHRILEKLNPDNKTKVSKDKLVQLGFSFEYFTSIYTTKLGSTYFYLYDQGYLPLENDFYLLVKRETK